MPPQLVTTADGCAYEIIGRRSNGNGKREEIAPYDARLKVLADTWQVTPEDLAAITPTGLRLRKDAPNAQLKRLLVYSAKAGTGYCWAIGDLYNRLKAEGVDRTAMAEWTGLAEQSISTMGSIAASYDPAERYAALSHSHHVALMAIPGADRDSLLRQAQSEKWTVATCREKAQQVLTAKPSQAPERHGDAPKRAGRPRLPSAPSDVSYKAGDGQDAIVTPTPTHHADGLPRLRLTADLTARLLESCAGDWTNAELRLAEIVMEAIR